MNTYRGALHVHSTYSDGEFSLAELREIFLASGCAFVCLTDHAESFDALKAADYETECRALSDDQFCFVAGLEYGCPDRMHVLGYGVTALLDTSAPEEVLRGIEGQGGVSVIAHPKDAHFPLIEALGVLPAGIEVWNTKFDGRYAPRPQTFALLGRLQQRQPGLRAFYGQDLHWRKQFRGLCTVIQAQALRPNEVLAALARGDYHAVKGGLRLPADGVLPPRLLSRFGAVHRCSASMRRLAKGTKRLLDRCGATVPRRLKDQLRRLF